MQYGLSADGSTIDSLEGVLDDEAAAPPVPEPAVVPAEVDGHPEADGTDAVVFHFPPTRETAEGAGGGADGDAAVIPLRAPLPAGGAAPVASGEAAAEAPEDLGLNSWFAEEMREEFLEDSGSVPESWRRYFDEHGGAVTG